MVPLDWVRRGKVAQLNQPNTATSPLSTELMRNYEALRSLEGQSFPRPPGPVVLTISNQKGGVGKTTTTVNLAIGLALGGLRVVVIDADPQGNASTALGIPHDQGILSTYDVMVDRIPLAQALQVCPENSAVRVCPATIDLAGSEVELVDMRGREYLLDQAIREFLDQDGEVDVVLIDCPPSLGLLTINAFVAADEVFIPIQTEYYALEGVSLLWRTIEMIRQQLNPRLRIGHILLTMVDGRTRLSADVSAEVREHFPAQVLDSEIPRSVRISEAPGYGQSVIGYDPRGTGAVAYRLAALELSTRLAGE